MVMSLVWIFEDGVGRTTRNHQSADESEKTDFDHCLDSSRRSLQARYGDLVFEGGLCPICLGTVYGGERIDACLVHKSEKEPCHHYSG